MSFPIFNQTLETFPIGTEAFVSIPQLCELVGAPIEREMDRVREDEFLLDHTIWIKKELIPMLNVKVAHGFVLGIQSGGMHRDQEATLLAFKKECYDVLGGLTYELDEPIVRKPDTRPGEIYIMGFNLHSATDKGMAELVRDAGYESTSFGFDLGFEKTEGRLSKLFINSISEQPEPTNVLDLEELRDENGILPDKMVEIFYHPELGIRLGTYDREEM